MESISTDGKNLLEALKSHPAYQHLKDPDFFVEYPVMHSPLALPGMWRAVDYLEQALGNKQSILLVGDRDVDGVTSTALLHRFLDERSGPDSGLVQTLVSSEGDDYGLAGSFLERILNSSASLIVLMDMGSAHLEEIQQVLDAGKRVIVLDHHVISHPERIPDCAFINPRLLPYCDNLEHQGKIATVGLVYKLLIAYALFHTSLWNRLEVLLSDDGSYNLYRTGAFLHSSANPESSLIPERVRHLLPYTVKGSSDLAGMENSLAAIASELLQQDSGSISGPAPVEGSSGADRESNSALMALNGLPTIKPELCAVLEKELVDPSRMQADPWLETEEGRLRAGQYLFAAAVMQRPRLLEFMVEHSDLAAIGLVTDMVPLRGENRVVARLGMRLNTLLGNVIPEPQFRPGLGSLYSALRIDRSDWSGRDFGWKIGPVLNAAGRMGETELALELLCSSEQSQADGLARKLVRLNEKRKDRTRKNQSILEELLEQEPEKATAPLIVCYDERLEPGVSGILASRLMERYRKPVVYMNPDGERIRGSVRSFGGLSALSILEGVSDHLLQYGGHPEAAGFSLEREALPALESSLLEHMDELLQRTGWKGDDHLVREGLLVDLPIHALNARLYEQMELIEPFGPGNPEPIFRLSNTSISEVKFMSGGLHAQITFQGHRSLRGVLWNRGALIHSMILAAGHESDAKGLVSGLSLPVHWITGTLEADAFRGGKKRSRFQFVVQDLHSPLFEEAVTPDGQHTRSSSVASGFPSLPGSPSSGGSSESGAVANEAGSPKGGSAQDLLFTR